MDSIVKTGRLVTADPAQHGGPVEFWNKREKRLSLMQVVATIILSRVFLSTCRGAAARERWEGKKNTFSSLARVRRVTASPYYNFPLSPAVLPAFFSRSHAPILNYIIYHAVKEIPANSRVPMLSSGSGLAEETVESIVGILGLRRWAANCTTWYGLVMPWAGTRGTLDARESCVDTPAISDSDAGDVASVSCALLSAIRIMFRRDRKLSLCQCSLVPEGNSIRLLTTLHWERLSPHLQYWSSSRSHCHFAHWPFTNEYRFACARPNFRSSTSLWDVRRIGTICGRAKFTARCYSDARRQTRRMVAERERMVTWRESESKSSLEGGSRWSDSCSALPSIGYLGAVQPLLGNSDQLEGGEGLMCLLACQAIAGCASTIYNVYALAT